jgi:hypothetical protein
MAEFFDTIADVGSDEDEDEDFDGGAGDGEPRPKKANGTNGVDDSSEEEDEDDEDRLRQASSHTTARCFGVLTGYRKARASSPTRTRKKTWRSASGGAGASARSARKRTSSTTRIWI